MNGSSSAKTSRVITAAYLEEEVGEVGPESDVEAREVSPKVSVLVSANRRIPVLILGRDAGIGCPDRLDLTCI